MCQKVVLWRTIKQKRGRIVRLLCMCVCWAGGGCYYKQGCQLKGLLRWHLKEVMEWATWLAWKRCSRQGGQPEERPCGGSMLGALENGLVANTSEGEWGKWRVIGQEVREGRGVWDGGWKGVALGEPMWSCVRNSEEDSDNGAEHPQGRAGRGVKAKGQAGA